MFKELPSLDTLLWDVMIVAAWHIVVFIACVKLPPSTFDASKSRYQPLSWEKGGRWYKDKLKINLWKDHLPQHIGKGGFSKEHFTDVSLEYLDQFILETCRGEWMHLSNCLCAVVIFLINPLLQGLLFAFVILLGNLPFAVIQRYNRFRIQTVRRKVIRDQTAAALKSKNEKDADAITV